MFFGQDVVELAVEEGGVYVLFVLDRVCGLQDVLSGGDWFWGTGA